MKRSHILLSFSVGILLSGCGDKIQAPGTPNSEAQSATAPAAAQPAVIVSPWIKPQVEVPHTALCNIDSVNGAPPTPSIEVAHGKPLSLTGWISTTNLKNPGKFDLVLEGSESFSIASSTNTKRADVAEAYKSQDLNDAGFTLDIPALNIAPGKYHIQLQHQGETSTTLCDGKMDVVVH